MTVDQVIAHLESRIGPVEETGIEPQDIEAMIDTALERTKEWVLENGHQADLERTEDVALGAEGECDIPTDILAGRVTGINHESTPYDFTRLGDRGSLQFTFADDFGYYAVEAGKIWTKGPRTVQGPLTGNAAVTGIFKPTLGTLDGKLEPYFHDQMAELAGERMKENPVGRDAREGGS
jgi:hypothetical protein